MFACISDALTFRPGKLIFAAEAEDGELAGSARMNDEAGYGWSGGAKVGSLGSNNSDTDRTVTVSGVTIPEDGYYILRVYYSTDNCERFFEVTTEQGVFSLLCPESGGWDRIGCSDTVLLLRQGVISLTFGSYAYCPDLDRVELYRAERIAAVPDPVSEPVRSLTSGRFTVIETKDGRLNISADGKALLSHIGFSAEIDGAFLTDRDCVPEGEDTEHTNDSVCGHSLVLNTRFAAGDGLTIVRSLLLPEDERGIFFRISVFSEKREISSGFLSPVYAENAGLTVPEAAADTVFVCETPYDNDAWVKYETRGLGASGLAHECLALGDGKTGSGVCIGSVTHNVWKTGIRWFGSGEEISSLTVYGGAADPATRDKCPHGRITGRLLVSPTIYLTGSDDWRSCLNDYGRRNAFCQPKKLSFTSRIPFGFNSWGVMADKVSFRKLIGTSDFFKNKLSEVLPESGSAVYINIDSFWTNLALNDPDFSGNNDSALRQFVLHCRENAQNAGIYHTPFAYWGGMQNLDCMAEQTGFSWRELALKLPDGSCYGTLDGGVALDPTHPGTRRIISELYEKFIAMGFSYIKLDFLTHGACEGVWYDKSIQTGTQAYSDGMKYINDVIAGRMFINESIAPLFPYSFADGRRISCDAWYSIHDTCDVMNHMTYGFWERELYRHPDPDHLLIWGRGGMAEEGEARARISSAVCVGGSVLFGEDFVEPQRDPEAAFGRFDRLMQNPKVIALALSGIRFLPLAVKGQRAAQAFWGQAGEKSYLVLFSFKKSATELSVDLPLPPGRYRGEELWSGIADDEFAPKLRRTLPPADAEIWCITEVHE